jgi:hypothetical protein
MELKVKVKLFCVDNAAVKRCLYSKVPGLTEVRSGEGLRIISLGNEPDCKTLISPIQISYFLNNDWGRLKPFNY